ncbi:hypothetical protein [Lunatimonas salinarum]|uniref:hypothetical protein n=1 Tax=Lunatimonas salinarum TaxID=1774590 RepID=UPI001FD74838|nr:hypothetical protein [Lunatimonas salinarum]
MGSFKLLMQWFLMAIPLAAAAQNGTEVLPKGARSLGMANTHLTLLEGWAIFNNVGAMAQVDESQVFVGYDHRLGLTELTTLGAGGVWKTSSGAWGLGLSSYGAAHFNQQAIGLGYSNKLGIASLGAKLTYFQTNIEGFGRSAAPLIELGGVAELGPNVLFGAHIYNLGRARLSKLTQEYLPTVVKAGISYRPTDFFMINAEVEKEVYLDPLFKMGLEYSIQEKLDLRAGVHTHPEQMFFGIGFRPGRYRLDYAVSQHHQLGFTHHFSFNLLWNQP